MHPVRNLDNHSINRAVGQIIDKFEEQQKEIDFLKEVLKRSGLIEEVKEIKIPDDSITTPGQPPEIKEEVELTEFEKVKLQAEALGIQVRSNSKIDTLKQKIEEKLAEVKDA